jgi:hypothetical protein
MPPISLQKAAPALFLSLALLGCGPPDEASRAKGGPVIGSFIVSKHFTPSGFMGDGAIPNRLTVGINKNCKTPRPPGAQGDCYHFLYKVGDVKWAGAYWVYPSNSWGTVPGRNVVPPNPLTLKDMNNVDTGMPALDPSGKQLRGYTRVRFYAAMDYMPTMPFVQFYAGGIDGRKAKPPQPYFDYGCQLFPGMQPFCVDTNGVLNAFAPTDGSSFTTEWKQYSIDLSQWGLYSVIGAFGWSSNDTANPGMTQSIYFDDIVWE